MANLIIIDASPHFDAFKQGIDQYIISPDGNALITVIEIIIVKRIAYRQAFDNESRKFCATPSPLFFRVPFNQLRINVRTNKGYGLFFQILRFRNPRFLTLLGNLGSRLLRRDDTPHLSKGIHIKRQVVQFTFIIRYRRIDIIIEFHKLVHIIPNFLIRSMENMSPIFMNPDTFLFFAIHIATHMITPFQNQTRLTSLRHFMGKNRTKQTATNN